MIVDIHRHALAESYFHDNYWKGFARMALPILKRMGVDATVEMIIHDIVPVYFDPDGDKHIAAMDEAGIDKSVMLLFDLGLFIGEARISNEEQNKKVFDIAGRHPGRIIPFVTTDPRRPGDLPPENESM